MIEKNLEQRPVQNQKIDVEKLYRLIQEGSTKIKGNISHATIVIGQTGVGKSTIINGLTGKRQQTLKKGLRFIVQLEDDQQGAKIGSTLVSETTIPIPYLDEKNNTYWDCPGFEDSKGPEQDIANGFFIKKIFDCSQKIKILLVLNHLYFQSDRFKQIREIVRKLSIFFVSMQKSLPGLMVVVNKCDKQFKSSDYKGCFDNIIEQEKEYVKIQNTKLFSENEKIIYSYLKQKSVLLTIYKPTQKGQFKIPKQLIQNIQKYSYIDCPKINTPISQNSKVHLYTLATQIKKKISIKNMEFLVEIERYLLNLVKISSGERLFDITQNMIQIYDLTKNIMFPSVIQNSLGTNTQYDKLIQKILTYFQGRTYSTKKQIQIFAFCKDVLLEEKTEIFQQMSNIWFIIQKKIQECVKKTMKKIESEYKQTVNYFIANLNEDIKRIQNDKNNLMKLQQKLQKFNEAKKIEVIPELDILIQRINKQSIYSLMKIHTNVKNINKILIQKMSIQVQEASQIVKNHLNEKLNQVRKHQKDIFLSESCVKTIDGQDTDIISSEDFRYKFINQSTGYYLSFASGLRMSYPNYSHRAETKFNIIRVGKNQYRISQNDTWPGFRCLSASRIQINKQQPLYTYMSQKKTENKLWKANLSDTSNSNSIWQFKLLKNGLYNIIHRDSGYLLKGCCGTWVGDSVQLGKANEGQSINWEIQQSTI